MIIGIKRAEPLGMVETFGGKTLSEIASAIAAEQAQETFAYAEARAYGADDVGGLISSGSQKRQLQILSDAGLTIEQFNTLTEERTNGKWAYFGISETASRILRRDYPDL